MALVLLCMRSQLPAITTFLLAQCSASGVARPSLEGGKTKDLAWISLSLDNKRLLAQLAPSLYFCLLLRSDHQTRRP